MRVPGTIPTWFREVFINGLIEATWFPRALRWVALRMVGIDTERAMFQAKICFGGRNVKVGRLASINEYVYLGAHGQITLGDYVGLGARVTILTATHEITNVNLRHGPLETYPVTIGKGSMIGAGSLILPGVTIGEGVVIGAGSVVVKDCEPNAVYVGNPARLVKRLEPLRSE
jgi:maltose O-acetyltransferase